MKSARSRVSFLILSLFLGWGVSDSSRASMVNAENESSFASIKRFSFENFNEWMTRSLGDSKQIPNSDGKDLSPANVDGRFSLDYALGTNTYLVFWQAYLYDLSGYRLKDPRFAFRVVHPFEFEGLKTVYDFFLRPGWSTASKERGKTFDIGIRATTSYGVPRSNWTLGFLFEGMGILSKSKPARLSAPANSFVAEGPVISEPKELADFSGTASPYLTYDLSRTFSTQHWLVFPYAHSQKSGFYWDDFEMPFIQNGFGVNVTEKAFVGLFLNNYILKKPTFHNTWASVWLSIAFL